MKNCHSIFTCRGLTRSRCIFGLMLLTLWLFGSGCAKDSASRDNDPIVPEAPPTEFDNAANRPPNAKTLHSLARILAVQGRDGECIYMLARIIDEYPEYLPAYNDLAEAHLRADESDEAIAVLNEGLMHSPNDPVLNNNLGMCWLMEEDYVQALNHFEKASAAAPKNPTYRANMAAAQGMLGLVGEARDNYDRVVTPADAARNMSILDRARAHGDDELAPTAPTTAPSEVESQSEAAPTIESQL